jgi:protoporphyrinogen/coproporphyrinogen III oxidase
MKIVVVGAGLSGLAAAWRMQQRGHHVIVVESAARPGGRCATVRRDGFIIDTGPEIASMSYRRWRALCDELGLGGDIVPASAVVSILRGGRMHDIDPAKPLSALCTPALSWYAKLRFLVGMAGMRAQLREFDADNLLALAEFDDPSSTAETVAVRAFGREAAEYLIDPLMRTLGGSRMSTVSALIVPYALSGWSQPLITLRGGLDRVPGALASALDVRYRTTVQRIDSGASGVEIATLDGSGNASTLTADKCLITAQYDDAVRIYPRFAKLDPAYGPNLKFARLLDVKLAYGKPTRSRAGVAQVPTIENPELLMFSLTHNKASDRAPPGHSLFTVYSEHAEYDRLAALHESEAVAWARRHIESLYPEIAGSFLFGFALRQPRTVCFSDPGYYRRTQALWERIGSEPRVHLGGDMMNGGSMEAAVVGGERAAERLTA